VILERALLRSGYFGSVIFSLLLAACGGDIDLALAQEHATNQLYLRQ